MTIGTGMDNAAYSGSSRNPFNYQKIEQINRDIQTSWLTLDEITQQLNLFQDESQDDYLLSIELATRMAIEDYLGMSIFPITYKVYYGAAGNISNFASLDLPEVSQNNQNQTGTVINSVGYWNGDNPPEFVTLEDTNYFYDPTGNKVVVTGIPDTINTVVTNPVIVNYTTNANPLAQYPVIKQAALMLLTHIYNNRSASVSGIINPAVMIPWGVDQLLRLYKPLVM
jgi:hypothetical protein